MAEKMGAGEVKLPSPTTTTVKMSECRCVNLKQDKCGGEYEKWISADAVVGQYPLHSNTSAHPLGAMTVMQNTLLKVRTFLGCYCCQKVFFLSLSLFLFLSFFKKLLVKW